MSCFNFQPQDLQRVSQALHSGEHLRYGPPSTIAERRSEDRTGRELVDFDDVSYDDYAELLYPLLYQVATAARLRSFIIIGAGPTGVELTGAIPKLAKRELAMPYRSIHGQHARLVLIEAGKQILRVLPASVRDG